MFASTAVPMPVAQETLFDVVEHQFDETGVQRPATYCDGMTANVTLQASQALLDKGYAVAIEMLGSQQATDFAAAVARRHGLADPRPQLCDAPFAIDEDGRIAALTGKPVKSYRAEIRLNAGGR